MILDITSQTLPEVKNPALAKYAKIYVDIYDEFMEQIRGTGMEVDEKANPAGITAQIARLKAKGAVIRNDAKSILSGKISPGCEACRTGQGSATFFISLRCNRNCFYCFNPNQENYDYYRTHQRDVVQELEMIYQKKHRVKHLALTGGEPLLFKPEAVAFYRKARERFPSAYNRLYTCGDYVDEAILQELKDAGLDEIRFSIRMHDLEKGQRFVFDRIALAKQYIPFVMVEMPVLPGTNEIMKEVLRELNRLQVFSINLLEFCFPYQNADRFKEKGYQMKNRPYRVLYDYWYAGGLPVAQSEQECLDLVEFALDEGLGLGVHYCSLENKHTGQIFQANSGKKLSKTMVLSSRDYFIKSAKVFGEDIEPVQKQFKKANFAEYSINKDYNFLEFSPREIRTLKKLDVEIGISYYVYETRQGEEFLRELKVDTTTPRTFDAWKDL